MTLLLCREPPGTGFEEAMTDVHISEDGNVSLIFGAHSTVALTGQVLIS